MARCVSLLSLNHHVTTPEGTAMTSASEIRTTLSFRTPLPLGTTIPAVPVPASNKVLVSN